MLLRAVTRHSSAASRTTFSIPTTHDISAFLQHYVSKSSSKRRSTSFHVKVVSAESNDFYEEQLSLSASVVNKNDAFNGGDETIRNAQQKLQPLCRWKEVL